MIRVSLRVRPIFSLTLTLMVRVSLRVRPIFLVFKWFLNVFFRFFHGFLMVLYFFSCFFLLFLSWFSSVLFKKCFLASTNRVSRSLTGATTVKFFDVHTFLI